MDNFAKLQDDLVMTINVGAANNVKPIKNLLNLKWNNDKAISKANELSNLLGMPDVVGSESRGMVIWYNIDPYFRTNGVVNRNMKYDTSVYSKLVIKDEEIPHLVPGPHLDWFYKFLHEEI